MCTTAVTYHESYGLPPRQFAVTFELRGGRRVRVTSEGRTHVFQFLGTGFRPHGKDDRRAVIELFLQWEAAQREARGRESEVRRQRTEDRGQRQLPLGDRV